MNWKAGDAWQGAAFGVIFTTMALTLILLATHAGRGAVSITIISGLFLHAAAQVKARLVRRRARRSSDLS